ncbi:ABC transporter permease [Natranaerobius trueperi]|uniref:Peptide ABC transporter permease n=1 Tax=Natranaerobius trueperi TaxID=759412 RepID=A0A226C023_9FIRM|nr:ABC transporter permease [Natranaerobius trueperi]OWZ83720.1 peptide ABC transporter permease [Natranaerobius trueperi]
MGTQQFIIRRLFQMIISMFIVATVVFFLFRLLPGNPTTAMIEPGWSTEAREMLLERFGLNEPLHVQYFRYLGNLTQLDFGISFHYSRPVIMVIGDMIWNTLILMISSMIVAYTIGTLGGVLLAWYRGTKFEAFGITTGLIFRALPPFFVGMLFIMLFSFNLGWFPHSGMRTAGYVAEGFMDRYINLDFLRHLILPMTVSSLYFLAQPMLIMRNTMMEVMGEDFVEMAEAKGLTKARIMYVHAARNALLPVVTQGALFLGMAIGGQVLIEYVFGWPGLGQEIVLAAQRHDYPVAQASFLMMAGLIMIMNFIADMLYGYLDPRVVYK